MSYCAWAQLLHNNRALQKLRSRDRSCLAQGIAIPWLQEEVKCFQSSGSHSLPRSFSTMWNKLMVSNVSWDLCLYSQKQQHCCGYLHWQLLFLDITHFFSETDSKRTNLRTVRYLMVQELRRKEYMTSGKWKFRKKLHGNLWKCCSSISKHDMSSEQHQAIVAYILMSPNNTRSPLTLWTVCASLEPDDNLFLFTWDSYSHRECCKGKDLGQDGYGYDGLRSTQRLYVCR